MVFLSVFDRGGDELPAHALSRQCLIDLCMIDIDLSVAGMEILQLCQRFTIFLEKEFTLASDLCVFDFHNPKRKYKTGRKQILWVKGFCFILFAI